MPHLLELFSGTGSGGKVFEAGGWAVTSVDIHTSQERPGSSIERHPDASRFDVGFASMHAL